MNEVESPFFIEYLGALKGEKVTIKEVDGRITKFTLMDYSFLNSTIILHSEITFYNWDHIIWLQKGWN